MKSNEIESLFANSDAKPLLDAVPSPEEIREQLVRRTREGRLLRSLLKLSQKIADHNHKFDARGKKGKASKP